VGFEESEESDEEVIDSYTRIGMGMGRLLWEGELMVLRCRIVSWMDLNDGSEGDVIHRSICNGNFPSMAP
jgi:KaiC/GvpD/RAD55 family RecA-like ATPase